MLAGSVVPGGDEGGAMRRCYMLECERRYQRKRREWCRPESGSGDEKVRVRRWFRLVSVKQITQHQHMLRKVAAGFYHEALDIAECYELATDVVYKHMWLHGDRTDTRRAVRDALGKVEWSHGICVT